LVGPRAILNGMQEKKHVDRRLDVSKGNSKRCAGEKNMWTGDLVGPRASLKDMQERKTCRQETWWVQGQVV